MPRRLETRRGRVLRLPGRGRSLPLHTLQGRIEGTIGEAGSCEDPVSSGAQVWLSRDHVYSSPLEPSWSSKGSLVVGHDT